MTDTLLERLRALPRAHWVDWCAAWLAARKPMFHDGWGDWGGLERIGTRPLFAAPPAAIDVAWGAAREEGPGWIRDGRFRSPVDALPAPVAEAHVRWLSARADDTPRPTWVVLAGSREEGFALRTWLYGDLVRAGVDLLLLETPFAGLRRAAGQTSASVRTVADHLWLNIAMVEEARALITWLAACGRAHLGVAGYSMGAYMAGLTAATTPLPLATVGVAAGASASPVYTSAYLSWSIDFERLANTAVGVSGVRHRIADLFGRADLTRYKSPMRPDAAIILGLRRDGYVPAAETTALHAHWPGSELRWIDAGHLSAAVTGRSAIQQAYRDAMQRLIDGSLAAVGAIRV